MLGLRLEFGQQLLERHRRVFDSTRLLQRLGRRRLVGRRQRLVGWEV
jgi:hypothetical protein